MDAGLTRVDRPLVGILGGTFDPIHEGHLAIARAARDGLGLALVLLVPAGQPPHKPGRPVSPAADRLAMVELAVMGEVRLEASRMEIDRPGPSYTVDTLTTLDAAADAELVLIVSTEALLGLPDWHEPDRILELCRIAVLPRHGAPMPADGWFDRSFPGRRDRFIVLDGPDVAVSASDIRRRARAGESLAGLVPPAVSRYIVDQRLYTGPAWRTI